MGGVLAQLARPPAVPAVRAGPVAAAAKIEVGKVDLSDPEQVAQTSALLRAKDAAEKAQADPALSPEQKAAAWEALAAVRFKGGNPYAESSRTAAVAWRKVAAARAEMQARARALSTIATADERVVSKDEKLR